MDSFASIWRLRPDYSNLKLNANPFRIVLQHCRSPRNVGEIENTDGIALHERLMQRCVTELVRNKTVEEALRITKNDIVSALNGLSEQKIHCSVLADDALKDAIRDYLSRNNQPVPHELTAKHERIVPLPEEMRRRGHILI